MKASRGESPPPPPAADKAADGLAFTFDRYGGPEGRHWAVRHGPDLVAVVLYRRGAAEVARRLNAAAGAAAALRSAVTPDA